MPSFPKLLGYNIYFWANEGKPLEPIHIHASKSIPNAKSTKFWLLSNGKFELADNSSRIPDKDIRRLGIEDINILFR